MVNTCLGVLPEGGRERKLRVLQKFHISPPSCLLRLCQFSIPLPSPSYPFELHTAIIHYFPLFHSFSSFPALLSRMTFSLLSYIFMYFPRGSGNETKYIGSVESAETRSLRSAHSDCPSAPLVGF